MTLPTVNALPSTASPETFPTDMDAWIAQVNAWAAAVNAAAAFTLWGDVMSVAQLKADTTLGYTGDDAVSEDDIILARLQDVIYQVAAESAVDHHLETTGGVKLYVVPKNGEASIIAFGAVGDGVTDDTAAIQTAINWASHNNIQLVAPPGDYLYSKLYGYYDATLNPGFNDDPATAGLWGLRGSTPTSSAATNNNTASGARFISTATTGCPFEFVRKAGETNTFGMRKLRFENITFMGATTDSPVLRTNNIQEPSFRNVHVIATGNIATTIWECVDCDQHEIVDMVIQGPGKTVVGSVGVEIYQDVIDASRCRFSGLLIRSVERAGIIGGSMADIHSANQTMRNVVFEKFASNECAYGLIFGGELERVVVLAGQFRGDKYAGMIIGKLNSCLLLAPSFQASAPTVGSDYEAQVVIGHPDATAGQRKFSSVVLESPDFPSVPASTPAIRWLGRDELNGIEIRGPSLFLEATTARVVHFNDAPQGGTLMDVRPRGNGFTPTHTQIIDEAGDHPLGKLTDFGAMLTGEDAYGWTKRNRLGGDNPTFVASAATVDLPLYYSHTITGTTDIESFTLDGQEPPNGTEVLLRFSGPLTLKTTSGSGAGNLKFNGGDKAVIGNDVVSLKWSGGGWRGLA